MERKIIINLMQCYNQDFNHIAFLLKEIGFDGVMINGNTLEDVTKAYNAAFSNNLIVDSIHLPVKDLHLLWETNDLKVVNNLVDNFISIIDFASKHDIKNIIMHTYCGFTNDVEITKERTYRFEKVISFCKEKNIYINFENAEDKVYLDVITKEFKDKYDNLKFCFDSGHENCYNFPTNMLDRYGSLLNYVHINDNEGVIPVGIDLKCETDYHYLPGDGILDVDNLIARLQKYNYKGNIVLEVKPEQYFKTPKSEYYHNLGKENYYKKAYEIACYIKNKIDNIN